MGLGELTVLGLRDCSGFGGLQGPMCPPTVKPTQSSGLVTVLSSLFTELMLRLGLGTSYKD